MPLHLPFDDFYFGPVDNQAPGYPIVWEAPGEKRYSSGLDKAVLYPIGRGGIPWNGLISVMESDSRESKEYYMDGIKYLDHEVLGEFRGSLSCFTYPDVFEEILGHTAFFDGVFLHDQPSQLFGLSYRTMVGDDVDGQDAHYIIHMYWNLRASMKDITRNSRAATTTPETFNFDLTSIPMRMFGARPTAHVSVDSRQVHPTELAILEAILYGGPFEPGLPNLFYTPPSQDQ